MKVLVATDGSAASAKALKFVLTKFQPNRSTGKGGRAPIHVSVLHVMPFVKYPGLKEANHKLLEQSVRKLIKAGFRAEPLCQRGKPAEEIMKVAAKEHADLIVMGPKDWAPLPGSSSGACRRRWCSTRTVPCSSFDDRARTIGSP